MQLLDSVRKIVYKGEISNSDLINALPHRLYKTIRPSHKPQRASLANTNLLLNLDPHDAMKLSWNGGVYEPFETRVMLNSIREGDSILDLGAFIGYYTVLFANKVGPKGKVYAFEPSPNNFAILSKNVKEFNKRQRLPIKPFTHPHLEIYDSNIQLECCAVTNKHDFIVDVYECESNNGMNRIYPSKYCTSSTHHDQQKQVKTIKLDEYSFANERKINLIKMDIEGSELGALEGMTELIHNNKSNLKIFLEFCPASIEEYGRQPKEVFEFLYSQGLNVYHLNRKEKQLIKINSRLYNEINIDGFIEESKKITTNLLAQSDR